ncbi:flagellar motor switch protein FliG [Opitutales bacterium]|nr:flagellar motor switch protein FliG [Opitutales bacterium]MDG1173625.1 flagellar motor switch protein FliG [Opitutales bacterium]
MDEVEEEESVQDRFERMSRHEKLALLMIALGPHASSTLLKRFDPKDADNICKKIGDFPIVGQELKDCVLDEFSELIESSVNSNLGGFEFAQQTLELAHGGFKANNIMNRIAPVRDSLDFMEDIKEMDSGQIYNVLRFEQPQTVAFFLANLDSDKGSEVLKMMPPNVQEQVVERVGAMETTPLAQVEVVANSLESRVGQKGQSPRIMSGGIKVAADLLNWFDKEEGKEILKSIEKRNPKLGGSIRQRMFRFEDIVRLSPGDISKITKEVDQDDLVIAMKNASAELKKAIYTTMSKRAVEALEEQLGFLGPKRLSEIEAAQDRVIQIVRELEEDEEIILDTGGSDVVVQ